VCNERIAFISVVPPRIPVNTVITVATLKARSRPRQDDADHEPCRLPR
jgi:hypothetical protein